jgi:hypothetical protein
MTHLPNFRRINRIGPFLYLGASKKHQLSATASLTKLQAAQAKLQFKIFY